MSHTINVVLLVALFLLAAGKNGDESYAQAFETWTEEKISRVERVRHQSRAVIWSKRCERQGKDALVKRADDQPWQIHCVERRVLSA